MQCNAQKTQFGQTARSAIVPLLPDAPGDFALASHDSSLTALTYALRPGQVFRP
jgi:hypothetical protein